MNRHQLQDKVANISDGQLVFVALQCFREMFDEDMLSELIDENVWEAVVKEEISDDNALAAINQVRDRITDLLNRRG